MKKLDSAINKIDECGDYLLDNIFKPILKGSIDVFKDEKLKYYFAIKTSFMEHNILLFIESLQNDEDIDIKFIDDMNDKEKIFFTQTINKVIDADDELQIYMLAVLTKSYKENEKLNYYEKSLYYNINQISKEDFAIYYCFYLQNILKNKERGSFDIEFNVINKAVVKIVLKKFISFGILEDATSENSFYVGLSEYSEELFKHLSKYFDGKDVCEEYMPIDLITPSMTQSKIIGL